MIRALCLFLMVFLWGTLSGFAESADLDLSTLTVRQAFDNALVLYESGHQFTADELAQLNKLKTALSDADEAELATQLGLIVLAVNVSVKEKTDSATNSPEVWKTMSAEELKLKNREGWKFIRDVGLTTACISLGTSFLFSSLAETNDARRSHAYSDPEFQNYLSNTAHYYELGAVITAGIGLLSIIPLVMGEINQE